MPPSTNYVPLIRGIHPAERPCWRTSHGAGQRLGASLRTLQRSRSRKAS